MFAYASTASGAAGQQPLDSVEFAVIDLETTGFSPARGDRIIEIGVVRVTGTGRPLGEWTTLLDPGRPVGASHVHRITPRDVAGAPRFADVARDLAAQLSGAVVTAHNASFEQRFLRAEFEAAGMAVPTLPALCTMRLARETGLDTPDHRLGTCCAYFGLAFGDAHAALADARATARLLPRMFEHAGVTGLRLPVPHARRPEGAGAPHPLRPRPGFAPVAPSPN